MTPDVMHLVDCAPADDLDTWDWTALKDEDIWVTHGDTVKQAGVCLSDSFDCKPLNITEKTQHKL